MLIDAGGKITAQGQPEKIVKSKTSRAVLWLWLVIIRRSSKSWTVDGEAEICFSSPHENDLEY